MCGDASMPYILGLNRNQTTMFPESIDEYVNEENEVRIIDAFVEVLDMETMGFERSVPKNMGRPGFNPMDMLKLYLYGYLNRIHSSRKLEKECTRNLELMWLLRRLMPDYKTIADFRRDNSSALKQVFKQFVMICKQWELFGREILAIDGSKFKASNNTKNNHSKNNITKRLQQLEQQITNYMQQAEMIDNQEASCPQLSKEEILERIKKLSIRKERYNSMNDQLKTTKEEQVSTVDPDSRRMRNSDGGYKVSYNVQAAVDSLHNLVVTVEPINQVNDLGQLYPVALQAKALLDTDEITVLADTGYYDHKDLLDCESERITTYVATKNGYRVAGEDGYTSDDFTYDKIKDAYICPMGYELKKSTSRIQSGLLQYYYRSSGACSKCDNKSLCTKAKACRVITRTEASDAVDAMKMRMAANRRIYDKRKMIIEPVFGTIKQALGFKSYLMRGKDKVAGETALIFCAYNLRRAANILGVQEMVKRLQVI